MATLGQKLLTYVEANPGQTATQIARAVRAHLPSVSGVLNMYVKKQVLRRTDGGGPRGGYVYYGLSYQPAYPTRFDRILDQKSWGHGP